MKKIYLTPMQHCVSFGTVRDLAEPGDNGGGLYVGSGPKTGVDDNAWAHEERTWSGQNEKFSSTSIWESGW